MNSMSGKLANLVLKKPESKLAGNILIRSKPNFRGARSSGPIILPSEMKKHTFRTGIKQLISQMDKIHLQHLDIKEELDRQQEEINGVQKDMNKTWDKINGQSELIQ